MFDLTGKTALVTGATGPIGGSIARILHGQGATVALSGTRREVLDKLAGELGSRVHVLPCNLAEPADTETLVPRAEELGSRVHVPACKLAGPAESETLVRRAGEAMGQLDILIANAGVTRENLL